MEGLTDKQQRFCEEYIIDFNATQAALRVGYSDSYAKVDVYRLLENPSVQAYLNELREALKEKSIVTAQQVIDEYRKIGFSNIQHYMDDDNTFKSVADLSADQAAAIESVQFDENIVNKIMTTRKTKLKLHSKLTALENLGKHLGIFEKDNKQKTPSGPIQVEVLNTNVPLASNEKEVK